MEALKAAEPNFLGRAASFQCGALCRVSLTIEAQRIVEAKFKVAGCTALVSALSYLTEQIKNKTTARAATIAEDLESLERALGPAGSDRGDCAMLASEALLKAIRSYSDSARAHWEGDDALICICFGVSERTIENAVRAKRLHSIAEVTLACNAGAGCRSCYPLIEDILEEVNRK